MQALKETIKDLLGWMDHIECQGVSWHKSRHEALAVLDRIEQGQLGCHAAQSIAECDISRFTLPGKLLILDVETTGTDPKIYEICEFGAAVVTEHLVLLNDVHDIVRPVSGHRDPVAMRVHGISELLLCEARTLSSMLDKLDELILKHQPLILAGWGVAFDAEFLRSAYAKDGREYPLGYRTFDVKSAVLFELSRRGICPGWGGLNSCLKAMGMAFDGEQHTAMHDVTNTLRALRWCAGVSY